MAQSAPQAPQRPELVCDLKSAQAPRTEPLAKALVHPRSNVSVGRHTEPRCEHSALHVLRDVVCRVFAHLP